MTDDHPDVVPFEEPEHDAQLDAFIRSAQRHFDDRIAARGAPRRASTKDAPPPSGRKTAWFVAAAAVLALAFVLDGVLEARSARRGEEDQALVEAARLGDAEGDPTPYAGAPDPTRERSLPRSPRTPEVQLDPAEPDAADLAEEPAVPVDASPEPPPRTSPRRKAEPGPEARTVALRKLDDEAQSLWRSGDIDGAKRALSTIAKAPGAGRLAELAYSDLITIARTHDGRAAEEALWAEYLRRFPRGRFADDIRASTCRRRSTTERASCWRGYLKDMPEGDHRAEAREALGEGER